MIDTTKWKNFKLSDLFFIETGTDLIYQDQIVGVYPVVGHNEQNHGITCSIEKLENRTLYDHTKTISLGDRGTFIAYVQPEDFYIGTRVKALISKYEEANIYSLQFISTVINQEAFKFCYGRNATDKTQNIIIQLPATTDGKPDWKYMEEYIFSISQKHLSHTHNKVISKKNPINTDNWKYFYVTKLFSKLERGKVSNTDMLEEGNDCLYVGAKKENNGVIKRCLYDENLISKGNCVVFICDGQGSVGYVNYMDRDFMATTNLTLGYCPDLNKERGIFIATVASLERPRYSYGRKWHAHLAETRIKLPVTQAGDPDWNYMENYIKSLPYGDCI